MIKESDKTRWRPKADPFVSRLIEGGESEEGVRDSFDEARPRSREDIMLDVRLRDGSRYAFSYAYLMTARYVPKDTIRMQFGSAVVQLEGRRLSRLYEALTQHKVRFVQEGTAAEEALKEEGEAHIERISVEDENDDKEQT